MVESIEINEVPTLIAIKKDGSYAFEVARGMISYSELEHNIILAKTYYTELTHNKQLTPNTYNTHD